jgi:hypothetical protein
MHELTCSESLHCILVDPTVLHARIMFKQLRQTSLSTCNYPLYLTRFHSFKTTAYSDVLQSEEICHWSSVMMSHGKLM